jgi:hypothetical protein
VKPTQDVYLLASGAYQQTCWKQFNFLIKGNLL